MSKALTKEQFLARAMERHGDYYDYSSVIYAGMHQEVVIRCRKHGEFRQTPHIHLGAKGLTETRCPGCFSEWSIARQGMNPSEYLSRVRKVHEGKNYDFSKVVYVNSKIPVEVICPSHGSFFPIANNFLRGSSCPRCARLLTGLKTSSSLQRFLDKAREVHQDKYDYSQSVYVNNKVPVTILCRDHGAFSQTPADHLGGHGCVECGKRLMTGQPPRPWVSVVSEAMDVHKGLYDYSSEGYKTARGKLAIDCPYHGRFYQSAANHLAGMGCPHCNNSEPQQKVFDLVSFYDPEARNNDRKLLKGKEIDILLPGYRVGIEVNGVWWHSGNYINQDKKGSQWIKWHQQEKQEACSQLGYRLFQFYDDEITHRWEAVRNMLLLAIGVEGQRVFARKCSVKSLEWSQAKGFFDRYHLQGAGKAGQCYGLFHGNLLVACAVFTKRLSYRGQQEPGTYELARLAFSCHVVGGASKLLKAFTRAYPDCLKIVSYSDKRFSRGTLYTALGFTWVDSTPPDYCYVVKGQRQHKSLFRRALLPSRLGSKFDPNLSEAENCYNAGVYRLYNSGLDKWELTLH